MYIDITYMYIYINIYAYLYIYIYRIGYNIHSYIFMCNRCKFIIDFY